MKEKKKGKLSLILLILSLLLIGIGGYLMYSDKLQTKKINKSEKPEIEQEKLDINSDDIKELISVIQLNSISNEYVGELKDYYYKHDSINDDLVLFLAIYRFEDVDKVIKGELSECVLTEEMVKDKVSEIYEQEVDAKSYKTVSLADGFIANWNEEKREFTVEKATDSNSEKSRYYGEVVEAIKFDDQIILTVNSYYASFEEGKYTLYSDSSKLGKVSEKKYDNIPNVSDSDIKQDHLAQYQFIFDNIDGNYKFNSYIKSA